MGTQARAISTYRRTQALLPAAEALTALVATVYEGLAADTEQLDTAWERLLLGCEHTWTSDHVSTRPHSHHVHDQLEWKVSHIDEGWRMTTDLARQALSRLAERINTGREALVVFNPLPWQRDTEVEIELEDGTHLRNPNGDPVPTDAGPLIDGVRRTRVLVRDLPPLGYQTLELRRESDPQSTVEPPAVTPVLDTAHYRVEFDPDTGRLLSLVHRATNRELADRESDYALGEMLYVTGGGTEHGRGLGTEMTSLFGAGLPAPELTVTSAATQLVTARRTAWGHIVETQGTAPTIPSLHCRWHFPDGDDRVELTVTFAKLPVLAKESVYLAFPFAISGATARYDRQQGWVNPATDHHPGACNEWFTIADAVTLAGADTCITWASADAPLFALGDVVRGRWSTEPPPATGTLLSWAMNNYWFTNTPASQEGTVTLRYAFRPLDHFDPVAATRLGRELRTPALAGTVTTLDKGDDNPRPLPARRSLLRTGLPDHVDATVFVGRIRDGVLIRLRELAGQPATATIWHPTPSSRATAYQCAATEDPQTELEVDPDGAVGLTIGPYEVVTVMLAKG